jgi:hypothetical protein
MAEQPLEHGVILSILCIHVKFPRFERHCGLSLC